MADTTEEETPVGDTIVISEKRGAETSAEIAGNLILYMDGSQNFDQMEHYTLNVAQLEGHYRETGQHREEYEIEFYITRHRLMLDSLRRQLLMARRAIEWADISLGTVTDTVIYSDGRYYMQVRLPFYYLKQPHLLSTDCISYNDSIYIYNNVRFTRNGTELP